MSGIFREDYLRKGRYIGGICIRIPFRWQLNILLMYREEPYEAGPKKKKVGKW